MSKILGALFISTGLLALSVHAKAATTWSFATGADYSAGKYGAASDTTVFSLPLAARAQTGRFRLDLTIPYLWEKGPGDFAGGGVVVPNGTVTSRSGVGDVNLGAAWQLHPDDSSFPAFEIQGNLKVPTAGTEVHLHVHTAGAAGQTAEIVRNGDVIATLKVDAADQDLSYALTLTPGQWVHVRLRDAQGITALTNPIYARSF